LDKEETDETKHNKAAYMAWPKDTDGPPARYREGGSINARVPQKEDLTK